MGKITAIEPQKRKKDRRSIFVDGEFFAGVDEEVVLTIGLKVGQQVDDDSLEQLLRSEEVRKAREAALNLLSFRARSVNELERRLKQKGYEEEIIGEVISGLERVDLLNDERFTSDFIKGRMAAKPTGKNKLFWELRQKGVPQETIDEALGEVDEDQEYEAALRLAESKVDRSPNTDIHSEKRRLSGLLQRRGFNWDIVSRVLNRVFSDEEDT